MDYRNRQAKLVKALDEQQLHGMLVTHLPNVRYLCGFTGTSGVVAVAGKRVAFFTDGRYTTQARAEVKGARIVIAKQPTLTAASEWLKRQQASVVGFEAEQTPFAHASRIASLLKPVKMKPTSMLVDSIRLIKDASELRLIRKAVNTGSSLVPTALKAIRPGVPEKEVAGKIELAARKAGADAMSFSTIVAAGKRSALPHGRASSQVIPKSGFVILDFGVILAGYCSDMTRTVHVGRVSPDERAAYEAVLEAQLAAIEAARPGAPVEQVDAAARRILHRAGLSRYFTHSTGHGVGLEIHEAPRIGSGQNQELQPGMVVTIEPGVYLPGRYGIRIEDMIVITRSGCEILTPTSKELIAL